MPTQDGSGGIWRADLSFSMTTRGPERLYECPAGAIRALVSCPTGPLMAATGQWTPGVGRSLRRNVSSEYLCGLYVMSLVMSTIYVIAKA